MNNAETIKSVYEKAWENYRSDVRRGLMPDVPFHACGEEQIEYIEEAMVADYNTENERDREFHLPVKVETPYED